MHIASLHVYPVKGARGIALDQADLFASGLRHDRRFMIVDDQGAFITQRQFPRLALVDVAIEGDTMQLSIRPDALAAPGMSATATVMLSELDSNAGARSGSPARPRRRVRVWDDEVEAVDAGGASAELLSDLLGRRCSLVFMPSDVIRPVEAAYSLPGDRVGFADGFPVLIASLASLADLNARLVQSGEAPVPMDRFRANIVVEGAAAPFAEEKAATARIQSPAARGGPVALRMPKPCARCQVTTVNQSTGETSKEPLRTLAGYRTEANKVNFAMNAIPDLSPDASSVVRVGDPVTFE